jgi:hypothetical protein
MNPLYKGFYAGFLRKRTAASPNISRQQAIIIPQETTAWDLLMP